MTTTSSTRIDPVNLSIDRQNAPQQDANASEIQVEFWGPPGSGKTLLLVSLYETLLHLGELNEDEGSKEFHEIRRRVILGQGTPVTIPDPDRSPERRQGERLTVPIKLPDNTWRRVAIRAHAGDDLTYGGGVDVPRFIQERQNKVFVACLNPFRVDSKLAWKGLQHMIAVLQSDRIGLDLQSAVEQALWTLFQLEPEMTRKREPLRSLLTQFRARLIYDPTRTESEDAFRWDTVHHGTVDKIAAQLKALIRTRIAEQAPLLNTVRQALKRLPHSMVVLTHVDIIDALLPSITFSDIERVFEDLFRDRPERMANQQALARPFEVEITSVFDTGFEQPVGGDGDDGLPPIVSDGALPPISQEEPPPPKPNPPAGREYASKGIVTGHLREKGATALVSYLKAVASFGRLDADVNVTLSHLKQQVDTLKGELQTSRNNQNQLQTQLDAATTRGNELQRQLDDEIQARTTLASDYNRSLAEITQRDTKIGQLESQLQDVKSRREQLDADLTKERARADELSKQLEQLPGLTGQAAELQNLLNQEREQHEEVRRQHAQARQLLARMEHDKNDLLSNIRRQETEIKLLKEQLDMASGEDIGRLKHRVEVLTHERNALNERWEQVEKERQELTERTATDAAKIRTLEGERGKSNELALAWQRKAEEIRNQAQNAIAQRDRAIDELRQRIQAAETRLAGLNETLREARLGVLTPDEKRARDDYEAGRMSPAKAWALLVVRSLPAMSVVALLLFLTVLQLGVPKVAFLLASVVALVVVSLSLLGGVILQWSQLGPRWIWLRSMNTKTRTFETLTSAGERVSDAPERFVLEKSPLLSILGVGVVRRTDTGQKYMTTEPDAWLEAPERPTVRTRLGLDFVTLLLVGAWAAAGVWALLK